MKYNLQPLDELIGTDGECDKEEVRNIIDQIKETAYSLSSEEEVRLYIRNHQVALLKKKCYDCVCHNCDSILFFLESYFCHFVDDGMTVSQIGRTKIFSQSEEIRNVVGPLLLDSLNPELTHILLVLITPESRKHLTIHDAKYLSGFWENWSNDFPDYIKSFQEQEVIDYLITHNFNSHTFSNYLINEMIGELSQFDQQDLQIELLEAKRSHYKRIPISSLDPYVPTLSTVNTILEDWLKEEMKKCKKRLKAYNPDQLSILSKSNFKIDTSMSVAQLACLIHTMYDAGVITNTSQSEVLQVATKMINCKKSDQISFRSLYNKYYEIEDKTKDSVKEMLKELLRKM